MQAAPGTYALVLRCPRALTLAAGRLGELALRRGQYLYVGSAFGPGGVRARARRHCRKTKKIRWHVDYLAGALEPVELWYCHDGERREHRWAGVLAAEAGLEAAARGFGASDCRCRSHLFFARAGADLARLPRRLGGRVERIDAGALRAMAARPAQNATP